MNEHAVPTKAPIHIPSPKQISYLPVFTGN